jgi:hypothetical protein
LREFLKGAEGADKQVALFLDNPQHSSLDQFRRLSRPIWSRLPFGRVSAGCKERPVYAAGYAAGHVHPARSFPNIPIT